jgi:hypothetical protein
MGRWKLNAVLAMGIYNNKKTGKADRESIAIVVLYAKHNYDNHPVRYRILCIAGNLFHGG